MDTNSDDMIIEYILKHEYVLIRDDYRLILTYICSRHNIEAVISPSTSNDMYIDLNLVDDQCLKSIYRVINNRITYLMSKKI